MAAKTGNVYTFATVTDSVKMSKVNAEFSIMASLMKVSPSDCDNDGQPGMAKLVPETATLPFSVVTLSRRYFIRARLWSETSDLPLEFRSYLS